MQSQRCGQYQSKMEHSHIRWPQIKLADGKAIGFASITSRSSARWGTIPRLKICPTANSGSFTFNNQFRVAFIVKLDDDTPSGHGIEILMLTLAGESAFGVFYPADAFFVC